MKKGLYLFGIFTLIGVSIFLWENGIFAPELEPITFSNEKYPDYRKQIAKRMNAKTQEMSENPVVFGTWDFTDPSDVEIALVDLNDDHIPEILALIGSRYYTSGVGGIELEIYSKTKGELKSIVAVEGILNGTPTRFFDSGVQTSRHIAKSRHKTDGYHDLCWFMETLHPQNDRKHFLIWRAGNYGYGQSEKITDDERGLFDENI
jgi:hypothetical protein